MNGKLAVDYRLIVALDVPDAEAGAKLAETVGDKAGFYKIGLGMLAGGGLSLAERLKQRRGCRVFLDMKLFDIGPVVAAAVRGLAGIEPDFLTVHGDPHVVEAAAVAREGTQTKILAVSVLTSLDRSDLEASLIRDGGVAEIVVERSRRAFAAGADGVICSPREARAVRTIPEACGKIIVTPGVRPEGSPAGGQKRAESPAFAIREGADHIVVGRPITCAADPRRAVNEILASLP